MSDIFVHIIGRSVLNRLASWRMILHLLLQALGAATRFSLFNHAVFRVFVRQVYFTGVQAIFLVCISALVIGSILVKYLLSFLTSLNAYDRVGEFLVYIVAQEVGPIVCTLIILLRSATAVISEVALMKINHEFDALNFMDIDILDYVHLPRITSFLICGPCLTFIFCAVALVGGYLVLGFGQNITFDSYINQIVSALNASDFIILLLKPALMALAIVLVALQKGMEVRSSITEVPIQLIQGMINIIVLLIIIELIFGIF
ncbi:MAG: MlaE family ABC transporter permease [Desulfonatronovibrionaceae bacterium]